MLVKPLKDILPSFDNWILDGMANYGGSDKKDGLIGPDGYRYMIKFSSEQVPSEDLATSHVNNIISEYIASHILSIIGYPVHETELGIFNNELVVACKNFVSQNMELIEFATFLQKHYRPNEIGRTPNIKQIYEIFEKDRMLSQYSEKLKLIFWERFVGDAFIGNFDRHTRNFGYLVGAFNFMTPSPIYDNGSTLFPNLSEEGMLVVLKDPKEIFKRIKLYPKATLELYHNHKVDYYDIMASGIYEELTTSVIKIVPRIYKSMPDINNFIDSCNFLSDIRKDFYKVILVERLHFILNSVYTRCVNRNFDLDAETRIKNGLSYTKNDFEEEWKNKGEVFIHVIINIKNSLTEKESSQQLH